MKRLLLAILAMVSLLCAFAPRVAHADQFAARTGIIATDPATSAGLAEPKAGGVIIAGGVIQQGPKDGGVIVGAAALDPAADPGGAVTSVLNAAKGGQWRLLAGLLLSLLVWGARSYGAKWVPWLKTDRGGAALVLGAALLGGLATVLSGDSSLSLATLANALSMAFSAAGGWVIVKKLLAPSDAKL